MITSNLQRNSQPGGRAPDIASQTPYWDERWQRQRSPNDWQKRRAETVVELARQLNLDQPHTLDLSCGTGFASRMLNALGPTEGIDLSPAAIAIARAENPEMEFRAGDVFEMELGRSVYDLIVCQEVIPHVSDQEELVNRMADALRPDAYLIITAANKFVMSRLQGGDGGPVGFGPLDPEEHIKGWLSRGELKAMLKPRFEILKSTTILPLGQQGILRVINSYKLNHALARVLSPARLEALKGRLCWGYTIVVVARKLPM